MPSCIACIGNELAKDDGVGMRIGRVLQQVSLPDGVYVRFYPQIDMDLIDDIIEVQQLVVCDATRFGLAPGTVTVNTWESIAQLSNQPYCCHGIGLSDLLKLAAELAPSTTGWRVHLIGVEAETVDEFGLELSPRVQAALPGAVRRVLELVAAPEPLIEQATRAALSVQPPDLMHAYGG